MIMMPPHVVVTNTQVARRSNERILLPQTVATSSTFDHIDDCTSDTADNQKPRRAMTTASITTDVDIHRQLHPKPRSSLSSKISTDIMIEEHGYDQNSGSVVSTTTMTTASTNSSNHSDNSTTPLPMPNRTMTQQPPTRRLVVEPKVIWYLRSQEIQTIVRCYQKHQQQQQQQLSSANTRSTIGGKHRNVVDDDCMVNPCNGTTATTGSLIRTSPTFLVITGPTGSGKTKLLEAALQELVTNTPHCHSGYYIRGTFDVLQHPDPYRVFILALTDFTTQVLARSRESPNIVVSLRQAILNACGDDIHVLIQMIPPLSAIFVNDQIKIPEEATGDSENFRSIRSMSNTTTAIDTKQQGDATQRFVFVLQEFLRAICSVVQSIVLVLEDVQYADDCSIDVLCSTLTDLHQIPGLFVAATYNGTDLMVNCATAEQRLDTTLKQPIPPSTTMTTKISYFVEHIRKIERCRHYDGSIQVQTIAIDNFNDEQVQYLLCQTLNQCTDSNLQVDGSFHSLVMNNSSGNLYRIVEFLNWLEDLQLLTTKSPTIGNNTFDHWTWNIDDIHRAVNDQMLQTSRDQNSNQEPFYRSAMLENLPLDVIEVIKVAACFGSSCIDETLLEYVFDFPIHAFISEVVDLGMLVCLHQSKECKQYAFVHENVQTLVYHLIPENDRDLFHLEIGRRLCRRFDHDELERSIFLVLSQMRMGRRLISRLSERYEVAALCLHAGRKAAKASSFRISLFYLKFGIELLGDRGWCDEYDLTLMLYNATAEMEVCHSNSEGMEWLVSEIQQNGRCADDTIQARRTQVYALCVSDRQHEGLDRGIQLLADLGYAFPAHFSLWTLRSEAKAVLSLLKGKSNDYIKRLPIIDDANVLAAMHVLNVLYIHAALVRPRFAAFVALKMMKLTLTYGLSFMAPLAFVTFGMLCIKIFPTPDSAFRYGELGLELLDKFQVREYLPRAYAAYYACIFPWKHHIPESLGYLLLGERVGMQTGDVEAACLCANLWGYIATTTDTPLDAVETHFLIFQTTLKSRREKLSKQMAFSCLQSIQYLQGKDVDFTETENLLQYSVENEVVLKTANIRWWQARIALLFNDLHRADEIICVANFTKNKHTIPPNSELVQIAFLNGMIALILASQPKRRDSKVLLRRTRKQYIAEGKRMIRFIEKYVSWAPSNYYDKQVLLEAELAAVNGRKDQVMKQYICAIALSKVSRNILVEGLSNERAGRYCLTVLNQPMEALKYFDAALVVYGEWKAYRKVEHLRAEMTTMFGSI